jgi:hypothetical protein
MVTVADGQISIVTSGSVLNYDLLRKKRSLKVLHLPLGLLINFNVPLIKQGIHRKLNLGWRELDPTRSRP